MCARSTQQAETKVLNTYSTVPTPSLQSRSTDPIATPIRIFSENAPNLDTKPVMILLVSVCFLVQFATLSSDVCTPSTTTILSLLVTPLLTRSNSSQGHEMENILAGTDYEHLDPNTPLSNVDIIKLLMEYCNKTVALHGKKVEEHRREEREHTNDMLKLVVSGLGGKIDNAITISAENSTILAEKIEEAKLKQETVSSYQEQLIYSLKSGLQDTLHLVEKDTKSLFDALQSSCQRCAYSFEKTNTLNRHILADHAGMNPFVCELRSKTFQVPEQLNLHVDEHTAISHHHAEQATDGYQSTPYGSVTEHTAQTLANFDCPLCGKQSENEDLLRVHIKTFHAALLGYHCDLCGLALPTTDLLSLHTRSVHAMPCPAIPHHTTVLSNVSNTSEFPSTTADSSQPVSSAPSHTIAPGCDSACYECYNTFSRSEELVEHMSSEHSILSGNINYSNSEENHSLRSQYEMSLNFYCNLCGLFFQSRDMLQLHLWYHQENPTTEVHCNDCDCTFQTISELNVHVSEQHRSHLSQSVPVLADIPNLMA